MSQLSHIRSRINARRHKMVLEISVVRLEPVADEFCYQWDRARAEGRPAPPPVIPAKAGIQGGWGSTMKAMPTMQCMGPNVRLCKGLRRRESHAPRARPSVPRQGSPSVRTQCISSVRTRRSPSVRRGEVSPSVRPEVLEGGTDGRGMWAPTPQMGGNGSK